MTLKESPGGSTGGAAPTNPEDAVGEGPEAGKAPDAVGAAAPSGGGGGIECSAGACGMGLKALLEW